MKTDKNSENVMMAHTLLKLTYGIIPIAAGADKFLNILTDWDKYADDAMLSIVGLSAPGFMKIIGAVEILAGILVFLNTKTGALIVSAWLLLIAIALIIAGGPYDVAVRDIVMAIGAFALSKLDISDKKVQSVKIA